MHIDYIKTSCRVTTVGGLSDNYLDCDEQFASGRKKRGYFTGLRPAQLGGNFEGSVEES
jgi:putative heme iron utilization protein